MTALVQSFATTLANLRANFVQTFLSMLGVVIGVGALVAMLSVIDGLEALAREQIAKGTPLENMSISPNTRTVVDGVWVDKPIVPRFDERLLGELRAAIPYPTRGQLSADGELLLTLDSQRLGLTYRAVTLPMLDPDLGLAAGHWLDSLPPAAAEAPTPVLVTFPLALRLAAIDTMRALDTTRALDTAAVAKTALGRRFDLLGGEVVVAGVTEPDDDVGGNGLVMAYARLASHPEAEPRDPTINLAFGSVEDVLAGRDTAEAWLGRHFAGIDDPVSVDTYAGYLEGMQEGFLVFRTVMGFLIGIAVVVGGVGIMNVLVMSVIERTAEIGIRKALGATRRAITVQFLGESVALSVIGSALGTLLGIAVALAASPLIAFVAEGVDFRAVFTLRTLAVVAVVAVAIGALFGTYPALRAARLDPVGAIQRA